MKKDTVTLHPIDCDCHRCAGPRRPTRIVLRRRPRRFHPIDIAALGIIAFAVIAIALFVVIWEAPR
jgi:hypothetical protein